MSILSQCHIRNHNLVFNTKKSKVSSIVSKRGQIDDMVGVNVGI